MNSFNKKNEYHIFLFIGRSFFLRQFLISIFNVYPSERIQNFHQISPLTESVRVKFPESISRIK